MLGKSKAVNVPYACWEFLFFFPEVILHNVARCVQEIEKGNFFFIRSTDEHATINFQLVLHPNLQQTNHNFVGKTI